MKELTKIEEILLVAIWYLGKEAYGVKVRQHVSTIFEKELTYGHLYSALHQLLTKKMVTKSRGKASKQRLGRPRLFYSITPQGIEALKTAKAMNKKLWSGISSYALEQKK